MSIDEGIAAFIGRIYENAYDADAWDACARELMQLTSAHFLFFSSIDALNPGFNFLRPYGPEDAAMENGVQEYTRDGYYLEDPTLHFALSHPDARFCSSDDVISMDGYLTSPYIKWTKSRFGTTHWLVGFSKESDGISFAASLHAHHSVGRLPERDERLFKILFAHMERALRLAARPPSLVSFNEAIFYVNRAGKVLEMSPAGEAILAENDGLALVSGLLEAATLTDTLRLERAIRSAIDALMTGGSGGAVRLPRPSGCRDLLLVVSPFPRSLSLSAAFEPAAIIRIKQAAPSCAAMAAHQELFGLTARETELAGMLLLGHSLESIASSLEISPNTVRVHLHKIFRKTGTNRQCDLVRMLIT